MGLAHIAAHEFPIRYAKSQIRVVAVFFIRRVLLAAIGAKLVLWIAVEFLAAALLAYRIVLAIE